MTVNLKNFLNPKIKISKMGEFQELQPIEGNGKYLLVSADLYGDGRDDLSFISFSKMGLILELCILRHLKMTSASINWNLKIKRHFVKGTFG